MGLFNFGRDNRVEEIKTIVIQLNKDLMTFANMVQQGEFYCNLHQLELMTVFSRLTGQYSILQEKLSVIPQSKISSILVPWNDGSQNNPIVFWNMSFQSVMDKLTTELGKWDSK